MTQNDEEIGFQKQIWTHLKSGGRYQIMNFGLREKDLEPLVIYAAEGFNGPVFVRTCMEFFDGRFVNVAVDGDAEKPGKPEIMIRLAMPELDKVIAEMSPEEIAIATGRPEPMSLELFQTKGGEFLNVPDPEERERRKLVVKAICATFGVPKWTEIPVRGREDAMAALNAYIEDMMRAEVARKQATAREAVIDPDKLSDNEKATLSAIQNKTPYLAPGQKLAEYVPPIIDRATDMKGVSITPGEYVELASLLSKDREVWGAEHYRKVQMVEPNGTVVLEGDGDNQWTGDQLIVKSHLDI